MSSKQQSNNNNINPTQKTQQQENQILWRFRNVFQDVHSSLSKEGTLLSPDEDRILALLYHDPTPTIAMTTAVAFGGLRVGRVVWDKFLRRGYRLEGKQSIRQQWKTVLLDASVGVTVGGIGLFLGAIRMDMDEDKGGMGQVPGGLGAIPLQAGRSNIADRFCGPLTQEYQRQWMLATGIQSRPPFQTLGDYLYSYRKVPIDHYERQEILNHPNNPNLKAYLEFVRNCQKRKKLEQRLRQERGLSESDAVEIPPPGVENGGEISARWTQIFAAVNEY